MKILVTGGAGFIGSFMTKKLLEKGMSVVVVDNLKRGHRSSVDSQAKFIEGDLLDKKFVNNLFQENTFDGVIHFAGLISMGESMENPGMYFEGNVAPTINLLEAMREKKVNNFIFSSTAGVYGNPIQVPIPESHQKNPTNPYGESKWIDERIMRWYDEIFGIKYTVLRYFNASGAALDGSLGENHEPETHIIPLAIKSALGNTQFNLFGTDYETIDGTCVRDYIHVLDLVEAHILALNSLSNGGKSATYNVGTGKGYSNKQIIEEVEKVSGKKIELVKSDRRPGDADTLIADSTKIQTELGFTPIHSNLDTIVESAWKWHSRNE